MEPSCQLLDGHAHLRADAEVAPDVLRRAAGADHDEVGARVGDQEVRRGARVVRGAACVPVGRIGRCPACLLYTSDAADEVRQKKKKKGKGGGK
ncbi:hypothetical protein AERO_11410 [Aeromicrobium fastidiosum]|nr:hypothetical protein [Aeromicrobium fastidiosum]